LWKPFANEKRDQENKQPHLVGIDYLRWLCALSILIWHYQSFYYFNNSQLVTEFRTEAQPFFTLLRPFYVSGFNAVPIFWIISGVVIGRAYTGKKSVREFLLNRFSRLYPLHLLTLVAILFLQLISKLQFGYYLVYLKNDLKTFILNLFFISDGKSFNAPAWSVSVEIFSYIIFAFLIMKTSHLKFAAVIAVIIGCFILYELNFMNLPNVLFSKIWLCGVYFFLGVLLESIYLKYNRYFWLCLIPPLLIFALELRHTNYLYLDLVIVLIFLISHRFNFWQSTTLLNLGKFLGNTTYSSYMIHSLVIIVCLNIFHFFQIQQFLTVNNEIFFLSYLLVVYALSILTFYKFERPIQRKIRARYSRKYESR
jgi:peptidoglycan/LPS O-acetylase OafA/YrhL